MTRRHMGRKVKRNEMRRDAPLFPYCAGLTALRVASGVVRFHMHARGRVASATLSRSDQVLAGGEKLVWRVQSSPVPG